MFFSFSFLPEDGVNKRNLLDRKQGSFSKHKQSLFQDLSGGDKIEGDENEALRKMAY